MSPWHRKRFLCLGILSSASFWRGNQVGGLPRRPTWSWHTLDAGGKPSTWLPPGETRRASCVLQEKHKSNDAHIERHRQRQTHIHQPKSNHKTIERQQTNRNAARTTKKTITTLMKTQWKQKKMEHTRKQEKINGNHEWTEIVKWNYLGTKTWKK